jgi:prepilin-type N-terminal cleavage/methylation domain-containing protein
MSEASRHEPGFTLVEILVALAILGLILATFAQVISGRVKSAQRNDAATQALLFARSMMERIGRDLPLRPGDTAGTFEGDGRWWLSMRPSAFDGQAATYIVELTVEKPPVRPLTLTTLRLSMQPAGAP